MALTATHSISQCSPSILIIIIAASIVAFLYTALCSLFRSLWFHPLRIQRSLEAQGVKGLPYRFFYGNAAEMVALDDTARRAPMPHLSHDIAPRILGHYFAWSQKFGKPFFFWFGTQARVYVAEPEHCRQILSDKFGHFRKPPRRPDAKDLTGIGLLSLEGEKWAQRRRIVNPAFFLEKLKLMIPTIVACTISQLDKWEAEIDKVASKQKEFDVHQEFRNLTADIIAHTAFGSGFAEGKRVFEIQHEQQIISAKAARRIYIPGSRWLPTSTNRYCWKLEQQTQKLLREMIYSRMETEKVEGAGFFGNDLLGLMMRANKKQDVAESGTGKQTDNLSMGIDEIVGECKTFFFAGHETTSTLLTWTAMLLGAHPEWQELARAEVLDVCGKEPPTSASLNNLRMVGMILYEALRLYPPVAMLRREAPIDMRLGDDLVIPQGAVAFLPILAFHHDPKYWGPNAHEFNPQRFVDGAAKASKNPHAFMPFSMGPRTCIGQNFALLEAKLLLTIILQRFTFRISPTYVHAPTTVLSLQPQYGMQIIFHKLAPP